MQHVEHSASIAETLEEQYSLVKNMTNRSHVMQWGDRTLLNDTVSEYIGTRMGLLQSGTTSFPQDSVQVHHIALSRLLKKYEGSKSAEERTWALSQAKVELKKQNAAESMHFHLVQIAYPGDEEKQDKARKLRHSPKYRDCELAGHQSMREHCVDQFNANGGFALRFHQVVVNICHDIAELGLNLNIRSATKQACTYTKMSQATVIV
jgi:hypothetical protein